MAVNSCMEKGRSQTTVYPWNLGLNCVGPLRWGFFSVINTAVLDRDESEGAED